MYVIVLYAFLGLSFVGMLLSAFCILLVSCGAIVDAWDNKRRKKKAWTSQK